MTFSNINSICYLYWEKKIDCMNENYLFETLSLIWRNDLLELNKICLIRTKYLWSKSKFVQIKSISALNQTNYTFDHILMHSSHSISDLQLKF